MIDIKYKMTIQLIFTVLIVLDTQWRLPLNDWLCGFIFMIWFLLIIFLQEICLTIRWDILCFTDTLFLNRNRNVGIFSLLRMHIFPAFWSAISLGSWETGCMQSLTGNSPTSTSRLYLHGWHSIMLTEINIKTKTWIKSVRTARNQLQMVINTWGHQT